MTTLLSRFRLWQKLALLGGLVMLLCGLPTVLHFWGVQHSVATANIAWDGSHPARPPLYLRESLRAYHAWYRLARSAGEPIQASDADARKVPERLAAMHAVQIPRETCPTLPLPRMQDVLCQVMQVAAPGRISDVRIEHGNLLRSARAIPLSLEPMPYACHAAIGAAAHTVTTILSIERQARTRLVPTMTRSTDGIATDGGSRSALSNKGAKQFFGFDGGERPDQSVARPSRQDCTPEQLHGTGRMPQGRRSPSDRIGTAPVGSPACRADRYDWAWISICCRRCFCLRMKSTRRWPPC